MGGKESQEITKQLELLDYQIKLCLYKQYKYANSFDEVSLLSVDRCFKKMNKKIMNISSSKISQHSLSPGKV